MSELDQLREELDDLRCRVSGLEIDGDLANRATGQAVAAAKAADRQVARSRSEWREVVTELQAGMSQIISLLSTSW